MSTKQSLIVYIRVIFDDSVYIGLFGLLPLTMTLVTTSICYL